MTDTKKIGKIVYLWMAVLCLWTVSINLVKIDNPDIWFHLQVGKSLVENRSAPDYSLYYFSPVKESVKDLRFTWLGDITFYLVHQTFGEKGLQCFSLFVVLLTCYLLFAILKKRFNGWSLLILLMVVSGTFQLQAVRNSMFAMPFIVFLFYLWHKIHDSGKPLLIWAYPLVLGVWSCMHGSYLLGFAIVCLILSGDFLDTLILKKSLDRKKMVTYASIILVSFLVISFKNPMTQSYYSTVQMKRLFTVFTSIKDTAGTPQVSNDQTFPSPAGELRSGKESSRTGFLKNLKIALNNTIVATRGKSIISSEYLSPFDALNKPYVIVSMAMAVLAFMAFVFLIRPVRFSLLLPCLLSLMLGLGYLRTIGYIPLVAAAVLFFSFSKGELKWNVTDKWVNIVSSMLLVLMIVNILTGYRVTPGQAGESFGFGRSPVFSDQCPDRIFKEYGKNKIFTTTLNGSYLLYRWYPEKRVFWDAFFSPHAGDVFLDFTRMHFHEKVNPDFIVEKYGIDTAVVELNNARLNKTFLYGENWYPRFMDQGMIFYVYQPDYQGPIPVPEILLTPVELRSLPKSDRKSLAEYAYRIAACHIRKGRIADTSAYFLKNKELLSVLDHEIDPDSVNEVKNLLEYYKGANVTINAKTIYHEWLFDENKAKGDMGKAGENGVKVINDKPENFPMLLELAIIFFNNGESDKSLDMVKKVLPAREKDQPFWENNRKGVSTLFLNLFPEEMIRERWIAAYNLLHEAYLADPSPSTGQQVLDQGMKLYARLRESGDVSNAYEILSAMIVDFPQEGKLYNEVALNIIIHGDKIGKSLKEALPVSLKAIELMEKNKEPFIDGAYYTLSEIYFRLKDFKNMRLYEDKALEAAPEDRKKKYVQREIKDKSSGKFR